MPEYLLQGITFVLYHMQKLTEYLLKVCLQCIMSDLKGLSGNNIVVSNVCGAVVHWSLIFQTVTDQAK